MSTQNEKKYIYNSVKWKRLRQVILDRHGGLCAECERIGYVTEATIIHHIKPWKEGKTRKQRHKLIWDENNLEPVCEGCHINLHNKIERDKRESGQIEEMVLDLLK